MISGIEHVAIASSNPEALARWYVDTLGFTINYLSEKSRTHFVKASDGSMIEIILAADTPRLANEFKTPGIRHLALTVTDFPAEVARLQALGIQFLTQPESSKGNSVVFFTDPEGNILHLLHRETPLP